MGMEQEQGTAGSVQKTEASRCKPAEGGTAEQEDRQK